MLRKCLPLIVLILVVVSCACMAQSPQIVEVEGPHARHRGSTHLQKICKRLSPKIRHCGYYEFQLPDIAVIYQSRASEFADDYEHPGFRDYAGVRFTDLYFEGDASHDCIRVEDWAYDSKAQALALLESIRKNRSRPQFTALVLHQFWFSSGRHLFRVVSESQALDSRQMREVRGALIRATGGDEKNIVEIPTG